MRSLLARSAIVLGLTVAAAGVAAPAHAAATVDMMCTGYGTAVLPANAPPMRAGTITVEVNGQVIVTKAVPGPCNAPGFVKVVLG